MNLRRNLKWRLIVPLAVLALIRPLLSVLGVYRNLPGILGPALATALIAIIWVGVVLRLRVANPMITLAATGGISSPLAYVSIVMTEIIWGAIVGLIAIGVRRLFFQQDHPL